MNIINTIKSTIVDDDTENLSDMGGACCSCSKGDAFISGIVTATSSPNK